MGIKNLLKFITFNDITLTDLKKFNKIAIDISCWLHKVKYADNCSLAINPNHDGWKCAFKNIFSPICKSHDVIFVFDGKTPKIKQKEHQHRRENFEIMKKMYLKYLIFFKI